MKSALGNSPLNSFSIAVRDASPRIILVFLIFTLISACSKHSSHQISATEPEKSLNLFNEYDPLLAIKQETEINGPENANFINSFDVDGLGNIFIMRQGAVVKYDPNGNRIESASLSSDEKGIFCVDSEGNSYFPNVKGISVYSPVLQKIKEIPLQTIFSGEAADSIVLKMAFDRKYKYVYMQVYDNNPLVQSLYKIDVNGTDVNTVFNLENPIRFTPFYSPGAFDFCIGTDYLYISDIYEYKIYLYSLNDGSLVRIYTKPFLVQPIAPEDAKLTVRNLTLVGLNATGQLKNYPPIFHLNFTSAGHLVVWTSQRNKEFKQVADIYDNQMNFKGIDLKFMHPGRSNYVFANRKVYVPDFGFGRVVQLASLSPLELPSKPLRLLVFHDSSS